MLKLNNLKPARGARKKNKRVGRGPGSGSGRTAGRGEKGQHSRSGGSTPSWFEGGQMPLYRRVPKRGFKNPHRVPNQVVNLEDLVRCESSREITVDVLRELGLVRGPAPRVKILGRGEVTEAYRVRVHAVSASAREKMEAKGGSVEIEPYAASPPADATS
jgi:large subunit ribosomal protein L15